MALPGNLPILAAWSVIAAGLLAPLPAHAQNTAGLRGLLVNRTSQIPIVDATVSVGDSSFAINLRTDRDGRFRWAPLIPGPHRIRARAIGYVPGEWTVTLAPAETLSLHIELEETPVPLPGILIEGARNRADLELPGFEVRRAKGDGFFLTAADIQRKHATRLSDIMRDVAGVREVCRAGRCTIRMTRNFDCAPNFFINGLPANNALPTDFSLMGVVGVEIYRTESETPPEFLRGMNVCGAIVLWTTRGR